MEESGAILLFVLIMGAVFGCRLLAGRLNHARIRKHIQDMGGAVVKIVWSPLGPGFFGDQYTYIYEVDYRNKNRTHRRAFCKTSMLAGVYFCDDRLVYAITDKNTLTDSNAPKNTPCYFIVSVTIDDPSMRPLYDQYIDKVRPIVERFGGTYLVRTENIAFPLPGAWHPDRVIVIRFESREDCDCCFASDEYKSVAGLRENSVRASAIIVDGTVNGG